MHVGRSETDTVTRMDHGTRLRLFDALIAEQRSSLEAIVWRLTGDRELFVEALQESLLQIWRHLEKLDGPAGGAYVYRIARSAASRAWRARMRQGDDQMDEREGPAEMPDDRASRSELTAILRRAISELPEQQGRAVAMRYLEQKGYDVMAREMACSEATVRSHVSKALAALRTLLGDREG